MKRLQFTLKVLCTAWVTLLFIAVITTPFNQSIGRFIGQYLVAIPFAVGAAIWLFIWILSCIWNEEI